jgi:small subunit ribosomal protein S18
MARSNYRGGTSRRAPKDVNRRVKKKPCALCRDHVEWVDYKDVPLLRKFMSDRGKIRSRRVTGNCAQHQRDVAEAIKTARELVLLPYTQRTVTERPGGRGGRGERGPGGRGDHERGPRPDGRPPAPGARRPAAAPGGADVAAGEELDGTIGDGASVERSSGNGTSGERSSGDGTSVDGTMGDGTIGDGTSGGGDAR